MLWMGWSTPMQGVWVGTCLVEGALGSPRGWLARSAPGGGGEVGRVVGGGGPASYAVGCGGAGGRRRVVVGWQGVPAGR
jgi:hypothetical protein